MNRFNYVITTDTCCDLPKDYLKEKEIEEVSLYYNMNGTLYGNNQEMDIKEFYDRMRGGEMPTTMAANPEELEEMFEKYLSVGKSVLHLAFSSELSSSCSNAMVAARDLNEKYTDNKVIVIDTLAASLGQGLMVYKAEELRQNGKTIDETAAWLEENKLHFCHQFTVDDLNHLYRGGRVSKLTAVAGTIIQIKPILHVSDEGKLIPIGKARGRKKSLTALVDNMQRTMGSYRDKNDIVFISHGDAPEDAEYVANLVKERFGIEKFLINPVSPTIGAHSGPGTIALFYMGEKR
ncbi:MAG: DegV family protein [Frisingicoccus sp.]|uniref:DegV family protein n=1 Tax=Frisingicoccus sp. TaxID=1918627 RepID=UPI002A82075F|nr:DegV family protein [Frisingicoccus sp.]MDY4835802.1 DegV family protein [Frisingicoccus sp.]